MSQNGKLMPQLDQQSTKLLNLTVLQRIDPYVEDILFTAAHVTFYEFNTELSQWILTWILRAESQRCRGIALRRQEEDAATFPVYCHE